MNEVIYMNEIIGIYDGETFKPNENYNELKNSINLSNNKFYHLRIGKNKIDNEYYAYNSLIRKKEITTILFLNNNDKFVINN
jgi:hypothetical protein